MANADQAMGLSLGSATTAYSNVRREGGVFNPNFSALKVAIRTPFTTVL